MWPRLKKELRWLMLASLLSLPLSLLFWLLYRLNDAENASLTMKVYWTGYGVMFGCIYVARILVRFVKNAVQA
jgi:hypothetical protein